jgi:excisionase family DNA binding protein
MYLLSVAEAAARWSVSSRSVWRWISAGEIKVVKLGRAVRIPVSEVERIARQGVAQ